MFLSLSMVTLIGLVNPETSPDQPEKAHPGSGVAVTVTTLFSSKVPEAGLTLPLPTTVVARLYWGMITVKSEADVVVPAGLVREILPVIASDGTIVVNWFLLTVEKLAVLPLKVTCEILSRKSP